MKELTETGAVFADGSQHDIDDIVYCTGYKMTFPFLSADCGICVDQNYVEPLFKHVINANYPTMAFIGLSFAAALTQMFDIQVRFAMKFLNGEKSLPSTADMKADIERYVGISRAAGVPKHKLHSLASFTQVCFSEFASMYYHYKLAKWNFKRKINFSLTLCSEHTMMNCQRSPVSTPCLKSTLTFLRTVSGGSKHRPASSVAIFIALSMMSISRKQHLVKPNRLLLLFPIHRFI